MIKIVQSSVIEEHLVEGHPEQNFTTFVEYVINSDLDRIDNIDVLATTLGGTEYYYPIGDTRIYASSHYYNWICQYINMSISSPLTLKFEVFRINAGQSTYNLKFRLTQNN